MALKNVAIRAVSLLGLVAFWAVMAKLNGNPRVLPGPGDEMPRIWTELVSGELLHHIQATLTRVIFAPVLAMTIGVVIGIRMGRRAARHRWLEAWRVVCL